MTLIRLIGFTLLVFVPFVVTQQPSHHLEPTEGAQQTRNARTLSSFFGIGSSSKPSKTKVTPKDATTVNHEIIDDRPYVYEVKYIPSPNSYIENKAAVVDQGGQAVDNVGITTPTGYVIYTTKEGHRVVQPVVTSSVTTNQGQKVVKHGVSGNTRGSGIQMVPQVQTPVAVPVVPRGPTLGCIYRHKGPHQQVVIEQTDLEQLSQPQQDYIQPVAAVYQQTESPASHVMGHIGYSNPYYSYYYGGVPHSNGGAGNVVAVTPSSFNHPQPQSHPNQIPYSHSPYVIPFPYLYYPNYGYGYGYGGIMTQMASQVLSAPSASEQSESVISSVKEDSGKTMKSS